MTAISRTKVLSRDSHVREGHDIFRDGPRDVPTTVYKRVPPIRNELMEVCNIHSHWMLKGSPVSLKVESDEVSKYPAEPLIAWIGTHL